MDDHEVGREWAVGGDCWLGNGVYREVGWLLEDSVRMCVLRMGLEWKMCCSE